MELRNEKILGIHHMSAITDDAQANVDFYTGVLGLRLIKVTVNFDDPSAYHLYYGDGLGSPGTVLTFFPYGAGRHGKIGAGQVTATGLGFRYKFIILPVSMSPKAMSETRNEAQLASVERCAR